MPVRRQRDCGDRNELADPTVTGSLPEISTRRVALFYMVMMMMMMMIMMKVVMMKMMNVDFRALKENKVSVILIVLILQRVFEYPPKWCTYSAGMAGATWNCCRLGAFCVHHTTMHYVTSCKATYVRCVRI